MRTSRTQPPVADALPVVPVNPLLPVDISDLNRSYSLYVLEQRAIPHVTDGLKSAARRVVWRAKDGKKVKTAALAGATMSIHPHGAPEGAIITQAGFFTTTVQYSKDLVRLVLYWNLLNLVPVVIHTFKYLTSRRMYCCVISKSFLWSITMTVPNRNRSISCR